MPIAQTMNTPSNSLQTSSNTSLLNLQSSGGNLQSMSAYKEENENSSMTESTSPIQHNYATNLPPTPNSMVTMLGPNSGKRFFFFFFINNP